MISAIERDQAIALSRDMNEYGARLVSDHKGRFGLFAMLPLPDVDASLKEIDYAFDTLHADGVGLLTSYGDIWLGDRKLQPVFDEFNRRNAIVYTHPTDATCCHSLANANPVTLEWLVDTARSLMSIVSEGGPGGRRRRRRRDEAAEAPAHPPSQPGDALRELQIHLVARGRRADRRGEPRGGNHQHHETCRSRAPSIRTCITFAASFTTRRVPRTRF